MTRPAAVDASSPLLTIAIPTYNRAGYLAQNLAQLQSEMRGVTDGLVEVLVSDNASPDDTPAVVAAAARDGLAIRYLRNAENIGWGGNFANCFERAAGRYVLLLGDDDLLVDGALALLLDRLRGHEYGVVCLRPYGFDADFRAEYPGGGGEEHAFTDPREFLIAIGALMTLISSCVINRRLLGGTTSDEFKTGDLAALPLVLRAALAAPENLFIERYLVAGKRQNSFNYEFSSVFVTEMWRIIDAHEALGLDRRTIRTLERNTMFSYYPFYALDIRLARRGDLRLTYANFAARWGDRKLFRYWLGPTLWLPRPLALVWGVFTTLVGRGVGGELRRGILFAWSKVARALRARLARR